MPNERYRSYEVVNQLNQHWNHEFQGRADLLQPTYTRKGKKRLLYIGETGSSIAECLLLTPGVKSIWLHQYSVAVIIDECADWVEVEPKVLEVLRKKLRAQTVTARKRNWLSVRLTSQLTH